MLATPIRHIAHYAYKSETWVISIRDHKKTVTTNLYLNDDPVRNRATLLGAGRRSVFVDL